MSRKDDITGEGPVTGNKKGIAAVLKEARKQGYDV